MPGDSSTVAPPSINSRIQMFNGITSESKTAVPDVPESVSGKPPDIKPLLPLRTTSTEGESTSYISRSHVQKMMNQQRKVSN